MNSGEQSRFKHPLEGLRIFHPSEQTGSVTVSCYYRRVINVARHRLRKVKGCSSTLNLSINPELWLLQNSWEQQWLSLHVILENTDKMLIFCSDLLRTCLISSHIHGHQHEPGLWGLRLSSPASFSSILSVPKAALDLSQTLDVLSNLHAWHD